MTVFNYQHIDLSLSAKTIYFFDQCAADHTVLTESLVWGDIGILQRLNSYLEISFKKYIFEIVYIVRCGHGLPV